MVRVVMLEGEPQVRNGRARSGLGLGMKAMQLRFMVCTNDSAISLLGGKQGRQGVKADVQRKGLRRAGDARRSVVGQVL